HLADECLTASSQGPGQDEAGHQGGRSLMLVTGRRKISTRRTKRNLEEHPLERPGTTTCTFELFAPYNKAASVKGTFSDWAEVPMIRHKDGTFRYSLDLPDGIYEYKFR